MLTREQVAYVVGVLWDADKALRPEWSTDWTCDYLSRHTILDAILYRIEGWLQRQGGSLYWDNETNQDGRWYIHLPRALYVYNDDRTTAILRAAWLQLKAEGKIPAGKEWPG